MSIAAAIAFALEAGLQGLVLDSGAVQQQQPAIAAARSKGLKVGPRTCHCVPRLMPDTQQARSGFV